MGITIAALIAMPILASLKRREARSSKNAALAADAVQSATCAYIALITLAGLAVNAAFHIPWFDSLAALVAIPILIKEGQIRLARTRVRMLLRLRPYVFTLAGMCLFLFLCLPTHGQTTL